VQRSSMVAARAAIALSVALSLTCAVWFGWPSTERVAAVGAAKGAENSSAPEQLDSDRAPASVPAASATLDSGSDELHTESIVVRGRVSAPGQWAAPITLRVESRRGDLYDSLHLETLAAPAEFGPIRLSLPHGDQLCVRASSTGAIPSARVFPMPSVAREFEVELELVAGNEVWSRLVDPTGAPVLDGVVELAWSDESGGQSARAERWGDDLYLVKGVPSGVVRLTAWAPGRAVVVEPALLVDPRDPYVIEIPLVAGGAIHGVVEANGVAVTDFELLYWPATDPGRLVRTAFRNASGGAFRIESAPLGGLFLLAHAPHAAPSSAVHVQVDPTRTSRVELNLGRGATARGVVLDAHSGAPLAGALVQPYLSGASGPVAARGAASRTDERGVWTLPGCAGGLNFVSFSQPGLSSHLASFDARDGEEHDLGPIALGARSELRVELVGPPERAAEHRLSGLGPEELAPLAFDERGFALVSGVSAGEWRLCVSAPDGGSQWAHVRIEPGQSHTMRLASSGSASLLVHTLGDRCRATGRHVRLTLLESTDGARALVRPLASDSGALLAGLPEGRARVELIGAGGASLAATELELKAGETTTALLECVPRELQLRVLDAGQGPVDGAFVLLRDPADARVALAGSTDSNGMVSFAAPSGRVLLADVQHPSRGVAAGVRVAPSNAIVELTLESDARVCVAVVRNGVPLPGVRALLRSPAHLRPLTASHSTDAAGQVLWQGLTRGAYRVEIGAAGCFPELIEAQASVSAPCVRVELRASVACEVRVEDASGAPVAGARIEWRRGALELPPLARGTSDAAGRARFDALPAEELHWRVAAGERSGEGRARLSESAQTSVIVARLP